MGWYSAPVVHTVALGTARVVLARLCAGLLGVTGELVIRITVIIAIITWVQSAPSTEIPAYGLTLFDQQGATAYRQFFGGQIVRAGNRP